MRSSKRNAFTLVELLVVITIIGILASLVAVAAQSAINTARNTRIKVEVDQLDAAMKDFKQKFGAYPPADFRNPASNVALKSFIARAFPRYNQANLDADLKAAGVNTTTFDAGRALTFWLSRLSLDVTRPFDPTGSRQVMYSFDKLRLRSGEPFVDADSNGAYNAGDSFTDSNGNGSYDLEPQYYLTPGADFDSPIVYFDHRSMGAGGDGVTIPSGAFTFTYSAQTGPAQPYLTRTLPDPPAPNEKFVQATDEWANRDSFQIISAGQDGAFTVAGGALRIFPKGYNYNAADNDNVVNFNSKATLGDDKP